MPRVYYDTAHAHVVPGKSRGGGREEGTCLCCWPGLVTLRALVCLPHGGGGCYRCGVGLPQFFERITWSASQVGWSVIKEHRYTTTAVIRAFSQSLEKPSYFTAVPDFGVWYFVAYFGTQSIYVYIYIFIYIRIYATDYSFLFSVRYLRSISCAYHRSYSIIPLGYNQRISWNELSILMCLLFLCMFFSMLLFSCCVFVFLFVRLVFFSFTFFFFLPLLFIFVHQWQRKLSWYCCIASQFVFVSFIKNIFHCSFKSSTFLCFFLLLRRVFLLFFQIQHSFVYLFFLSLCVLFCVFLCFLLVSSFFRRFYTSSKLTTKNKFSFQHGRAEARIKLPPGGQVRAQTYR